MYLISWWSWLSCINLVVGSWWNAALLSWRPMQRDSPMFSDDPSQPQATPMSTPVSRYAMPVSLCYRVSGFSQTQSQLCREHFDHMPIVSVGARIGITECRKQFRYRQWNCSSDEEHGLFGPVANQATKETAFAHAVSSAGLVHALARSCKEARLANCGCGQDNRPTQLHNDWLWGGCSDNLQYALNFTEAFVDAKEKEKSFPRGSSGLAKSLMNLHNNRVGRNAVCNHASVACKCHGVSGSCSLRTCWRQLVPFSSVGEKMVQLYDGAIQMKFNRRGTRLRRAKRNSSKPSDDDMIYLEESPDYCQSNDHSQSVSVRGRECNPHSNGTDSCSHLCCHGQYTMIEQEIPQKCNCKFFWCCHVQCDTCIWRKTSFICK